jgi:hypothetical protein
MTESDSNRLGLTEEDLRFVVEEAGPDAMDPERLKELIRDDPSFRNALVGDDRVFDRVTSSEDEELLKVSPALYFDVLLRRALKDLGQESHTLERSGSETVVVFDTNEVTEFLSNGAVIDYLAAMLASFTKVESYVMPVRVRRGTWRRVRFNDMDIDSLVKLAASVDESQQFRYFKRIADVCLFVLGIFPNHAQSGGRKMFIGATPSGVSRRGRRTEEEYTDIGRRFYQTAGRHPTADAAGLTEPMNLLRDNFGVARKVLNIVSERYLRYSRGKVFDVGIS